MRCIFDDEVGLLVSRAVWLGLQCWRGCRTVMDEPLLYRLGVQDLALGLITLSLPRCWRRRYIFFVYIHNVRFW